MLYYITCEMCAQIDFSCCSMLFSRYYDNNINLSHDIIHIMTYYTILVSEPLKGLISIQGP